VNAIPVIARELREESRRSANYWLRVLAAGALILVFAAFVFATEVDLAELGAALFLVLHRTLLFGFWIIVPLMTADCVSRERRDGTLGLLFLTPLTVADVIAGKAAIHSLRAVTLFLAGLPILGLPFVFGGVGWQSFCYAVLQLANAVLMGIAAGIYASTKGGSTVQVMVRAEGYALLLMIASFVWMTASGVFALSNRPGFLWSVASTTVLSLFFF
jgi:ABC-type transport system involved in cytochrome c biogenesis permease component